MKKQALKALVRQLQRDNYELSARYVNLEHSEHCYKVVGEHLEATLQSCESALLYKDNKLDEAIHAVGVLSLRLGLDK